MTEWCQDGVGSSGNILRKYWAIWKWSLDNLRTGYPRISGWSRGIWNNSQRRAIWKWSLHNLRTDYPKIFRWSRGIWKYSQIVQAYLQILLGQSQAFKWSLMGPSIKKNWSKYYLSIFQQLIKWTLIMWLMSDFFRYELPRWTKQVMFLFSKKKKMIICLFSLADHLN